MTGFPVISPVKAAFNGDMFQFLTLCEERR